MMRFLAGVLATMLLMGAGMLWWKDTGRAEQTIPPAPPSAGTFSPIAAPAPVDPPQASQKTREEKRFGRYDKDKNGAISRDEYLVSRRKAFAKLDTNGDGRMSFEEYAAKSVGKFAGADRDKTGLLTAEEFATTRVARTSPTRRNCPPPVSADAD